MTVSMLVPYVSTFCLLGSMYFSILLLLMLSIALFEFFKIIECPYIINTKYYDVSIGLSYIYVSSTSIFYIKSNSYFPCDIIALFFIAWTFDSTSYIVGTSMGKQQLLPKISPNKTWLGVLGGCFLTMILSFFLIKKSIVINPKWYLENFLIFFIVCICYKLFCLLGQFGDLLESYFKRKFHVKDSGTLLPGHGGFLDRFDGISLIAVFLFIYLKFV